MICLFLADGFEEIEALTPLDLLIRAGADIKTVGIGKKRVTGAHGISLFADMCDEEIDFSKIDTVILPGGMPGTLNLDSSPTVHKAIDTVTNNNGRIAAICAAPSILGKRGLLCGKVAVCYPGFENSLTGATVLDLPVVTDGNITTARGAGCALDFGLELVRLIFGSDSAAKLSDTIIKPKQG